MLLFEASNVIEYIIMEIKLLISSTLNQYLLQWYDVINEFCFKSDVI